MSNLIFRQLFDRESCTYTYLLADDETRQAALIDPVIELVERDIKLISELDLKLKYTLETHVHADHITATTLIKKQFPEVLSVCGRPSQVECADILIDEFEKLNFGEFSIEALFTPGHTDGCTSYLCENMVFTGDTLFIRGCGRTDFQQGSSKTLFHSVRNKLFKLDPNTIVYPAHDYNGRDFSTIAEEKLHNPRLKIEHEEADFLEIMNNLKLGLPDKIHEAVPANLICGKVD